MSLSLMYKRPFILVSLNHKWCLTDFSFSSKDFNWFFIGRFKSRKENFSTKFKSTEKKIIINQQLTEKKYQTAERITKPDFILLFVPIEASFGVAIIEDVDLFSFA